MTSGREHQVAETCVALMTDTVVSDHDALDRMTMLVEAVVGLLDVTAASVLLTDLPVGPAGPEVASPSTERFRLLEVFAVEAGRGEDDVHIGHAVIDDLRAEDAFGRRPRFGTGAGEGGVAGVHALPMRLHDQTFGSLILLHALPHTLLPEPEVRLGQALADAATVGLCGEPAARSDATMAEQLRRAVAGRVFVAQAEGMLAEQGNLDPTAALAVLRRYSRDQKLRLSDVAGEVIAGRLDLASIVRSSF